MKLQKDTLNLIVLVFLTFGLCACGHQNKKRPNILFILVDDLGYNDLGYTGSTFYETPNIDELASEGMVFTNAYAASPICSPSRASILSGKYPARLQLTDYIPGNRHWGPHKDQRLTSKPFKLQLDREELTIAEALRNSGYSTMFAGKWHLGEESEFYPQYQGFDINIAGNSSGHPNGGYFSPYKNPQIIDGYEGEYLTDRLTDEVIHFINQNSKEPFLAYLSFYTVHLPMQGKPEKIKKYQKKLSRMSYSGNEFDKNEGTFYKSHQNIPTYAAMVESMDENVGRVLKALEEKGIADNTIVIFTSDNGGMSTSNRIDNIPTSNTPLRAGKGFLYEGGIREPLIIRYPRGIKACSTSDIPVTGTDFYPTLLDLANIDLISEQHQDGISLKPIFEGKDTKERPIFWHYPHYSGGLGGKPSGAVRFGHYKLIEFYEDMNVELYNLKTDIGENQNLSTIKPEKTAELLSLLHNWRKETNAQMPFQNPHFKKSEEKKKLK
ncbi:MAG: sulfatase [Flavobacteriaceae bacterium]